jgi:hypothetical protein
VPLANFTDQLLGEKPVGDKWFISLPFLLNWAMCVCFHLDLVWSCELLSSFLFLSWCESAWLLIVGRLASEQGGECALL